MPARWPEWGSKPRSRRSPILFTVLLALGVVSVIGMIASAAAVDKTPLGPRTHWSIEQGSSHRYDLSSLAFSDTNRSVTPPLPIASPVIILDDTGGGVFQITNRTQWSNMSVKMTGPENTTLVIHRSGLMLYSPADEVLADEIRPNASSFAVLSQNGSRLILARYLEDGSALENGSAVTTQVPLDGEGNSSYSHVIVIETFEMVYRTDYFDWAFFGCLVGLLAILTVFIWYELQQN